MIFKRRHAFASIQHLLCASALALAAGLQAAECANTTPPSRPSPDWRDQVIYFVMTDRFFDGDPSNNEQGAGVYRPGDGRYFQGGDLKGLMAKLDYIQGLGATALWITPPVRNQWWDGQGAGYHGYWASHLKEVDPHLGSLADYRCLAAALHARGMHLIQDVVPNHMGNYFGYAPGQWRRGQPASGWRSLVPSGQETAPTQAPFDLNDPRNPAHRAASIYHWTPNVANYQDSEQELNWQMSGLDDLNTENPAVRRALRDSYGFWLREVGVDALRVDTAFYIPPSFFTDWLHSKEAAAPGLAAVAAGRGRQDLLVFGEAFGIDKPFETRQMRRIHAYQRAGRMNGMLNFPLYGSLQATFARGGATAELAQRLRDQARIFGQRQHRMPSFIDNHDVDRFLSGGSLDGMRQALLALFTLPGLPTVYYGTEQGFTEPRATMFAAGVGSGGRDRFDSSAPLYRLLAELAALRRAEPLFSRGSPQPLRASSTGPGVLAWRTQHSGRSALVVFNTSEHPQWLDALPLGDTADPAHAQRVRLTPRFGLNGLPPPLLSDARGHLSLELPPHSGQVWLLEPFENAMPLPLPGETRELGLAPGALRLAGRVPPGDEAELVIDGDLSQRIALPTSPQGQWQASVPTGNWLAPEVEHRIALRHRAPSASDWTAGAALARKVPVQWQLLSQASDPLGDDRGPSGHYDYPSDPSWGSNRQMDLRGLQVSGLRGGSALQIDIDMARITTSWNPANGFDHVALTLFIELPGQSGGSRLMPLQGGELPGGMVWHRRLRVHGWSNAWFSSEGATAQLEGRPVSPGARLEVKAAKNRLRITLPANALPAGASLDGARAYLNTWDWDGGYRPLLEQAGGHQMGGRRAPTDRLEMDTIGPLRLRRP